MPQWAGWVQSSQLTEPDLTTLVHGPMLVMKGAGSSSPLKRTTPSASVTNPPSFPMTFLNAFTYFRARAGEGG